MVNFSPRLWSFAKVQGSRPAQEDDLLIHADRGLFAVADGFGGPVAGAEASKLACAGIAEFLERGVQDEDATLPFLLRKHYSLAGNVLCNAIIHANRRLIKLNQGKNVHEKGGASLIAGYWDGPYLVLGSVGLCEAWLGRGETWTRLNLSRSYARMMAPGQQRLRPAWQFPLAALGIHSDLEPEVLELRLQLGDTLLFHTDGLALGGEDYVLRKAVEEKGLESAVQSLREGNYQDNVACLGLQF